MKVIEAGNIMCECGNDELVFVKALPPFLDTFVILCRKCMRRGTLEAATPLNLKDLPSVFENDKGGDPE